MFFMAIAAIVAMTVFVQRGLQSRMRDAKMYMVDRATDGCVSAVGTNCKGLSATGQFNYEYEPYYTAQTADVSRKMVSNAILNTTDNTRKTFQQTIISSDGEQQTPWKAN